MEEVKTMKMRMGVWILLCALFALCLLLLAQRSSEAQAMGGQAAASAATDSENMNIFTHRAFDGQAGAAFQ
jgi:preprotein translocase subunit SecG